ncbi:MAG: LutC/YkgG family protein [Bacillota bacterium]
MMLTLEESYKLFAANATITAAEVFRALTPEEARVVIIEYIERLKPSCAAWVASPLLEKINFLEIAQRAGVQPLSDGLTVEQAARADLGVLVVDLAIAETGTVVHDATRIESRLVTTLPAACLVLVPTKRILPSLLDAFAYVEKNWAQPVGYLAMITGPSRSADIERVLTIGVHGPEKLAILCCDWWDDEGAEQDER